MVELAHEQLATQWPRYQRWLRGTAQRAEEKRILDRLMERVARWQTLGKRRGDLAIGTDRREFQRLRKEQLHWLAPEERRFVARSHRQAIFTQLGLATAVLAAVVLVAWGYLDQRRQTYEARATGIWYRLELGSNAPLSDSEVQALTELAV